MEDYQAGSLEERSGGRVLKQGWNEGEGKKIFIECHLVLHTALQELGQMAVG